jgi:cell division protein FtsW
MLGVAFIMFCVAGMRWIYLFISACLGLVALWFLIQSEGYRAMRLTYFLDPWPYYDVFGGSYQLIQSLAAFAQGGLLGRGAGAGAQKLGYLPEAHNDFVFAVIGEEFGLVGTLAVVLLFAVLGYATLRISMYAADRFGSLLAMGVAMLILLQAAFVMAVTTGMAPTKGLPLPFVSYGGTALIVFMGLAGILVNIAAQAPDVDKQRRKSAA